MNKIKIDIPKGHKATFDEAKGEISFVELPKNPREKLNTWNDILEHHKMTQQEFDNWCNNLQPHEIGRRQEEMIVAAYNGRQLNDPLPEWGDGTIPKRYPIFKMPSASGSRFAFNDDDCWRSSSDVGPRQVFYGDESRENLLDAVEKFLPEYEKSRTL